MLISMKLIVNNGIKVVRTRHASINKNFGDDLNPPNYSSSVSVQVLILVTNE